MSPETINIVFWVMKIIAALIGCGLIVLIALIIRSRLRYRSLTREERRALKERRKHGKASTISQISNGASIGIKPLTDSSTNPTLPAVPSVVPEEDYECEINEANAFVIASALKGGIHYEDLPDEKIPEGSQPWVIEWANNKSMHTLVKKDSGEYQIFEPGDEILQYPGDLFGTIQAKEIKEFFKMQQSALEKIAFWALVIIICVSLFIGFILVTSK